MPYININQNYVDGTGYRATTNPYHHELSDVTYTGTISSLQPPTIIMSDLMKEEIKKLYDEWCGEIVDGKVDKAEIEAAIPLINWHEITMNKLQEQVQECDARISLLQTQLEELQEQLKYLGFEKLLME